MFSDSKTFINMPESPISLRSKLPNTGTTIFTIMSKMANDYNAINLSQGFPDFEAPAKLFERVHHYMKSGCNQYAPMPGVLSLREAIAEKAEDLYSASFNPETEITITAGATQALFSAIAAVVQEGDEVIVFEPAYDSYVPAIKLNGGIPIFMELEAPEYKIDWDKVKSRISHRTRLIIINTPHNPTGAALNAFDMMQLEKLTSESDIMILSDEVYEHILFDGYEHQSVLRFPKLAERSFVVFSVGKTYHNTGWKVGYCLAPEAMMKEFRKVHQFIVFTVNTPVQMALSEIIREKEHYLELNTFYQEKRDTFNRLIQGSRFEVRPSKGTYFQLLGYQNITDKPDTEFATELTQKNGVASIPISVFYRSNVDNKMLRFCFAKSDETLERAAEKLCKL